MDAKDPDNPSAQGLTLGSLAAMLGSALVSPLSNTPGTQMTGSHGKVKGNELIFSGPAICSTVAGTWATMSAHETRQENLTSDPVGSYAEFYSHHEEFLLYNMSWT